MDDASKSARFDPTIGPNSPRQSLAPARSPFTGVFSIAGARYIVVQSGKAEMAFALIDEYQGRGIGRALLHHIAAIASHAGLEELIAEVLPDNIPMLKVFETSGFPMRTKREAQVVHVSLRLS